MIYGDDNIHDAMEKIAGVSKARKREMSWPGRIRGGRRHRAGSVDRRTGRAVMEPLPKHKIVPTHLSKKITPGGLTNAPGYSGPVTSGSKKFIMGRTLAYEKARGSKFADKVVRLLKSPSQQKRALGKVLLRRYI